jgi:hypothetical protein
LFSALCARESHNQYATSVSTDDRPYVDTLYFHRVKSVYRCATQYDVWTYLVGVYKLVVLTIALVLTNHVKRHKRNQRATRLFHSGVHALAVFLLGMFYYWRDQPKEMQRLMCR